MNSESKTTLRSTSVQSANRQRAHLPPNPIGVFVSKDRTAFLWFCVAMGACGVAVFTPFWMLSQFRQRERVVIVDPAGTYYLSPLLDFREAKEFHVQQSTLAATAFLERQPGGLDHPELLKQLFLKPAQERVQKHLLTEAEEFKSKQLHQKAEIARIDILETRDDAVMTQITGQLIRTGIFEQRAFTESISFRLGLRLRRNPDMSRNGRFPTAVSEFKYEPNR
ncbi:MAG: hypothetical protein RLZZ399_1119 [Verrucomicrobiota bacterium]|jgi:hypothetical protein